MPAGYRWVRDDCGRGWSIISGRRATFIALAFFLAGCRVGSTNSVDDEHGGTDIKVPGTPQEGIDQQLREHRFDPTEAAPEWFENPRANQQLFMPTQVKVRVVVESGQYLALVVDFNITYQTLVDRIDANLPQFTSKSIGNGMLKLRYRDGGGDLVVIEDDEGVRNTFMEWHKAFWPVYPGDVGEINLFCIGDGPSSSGFPARAGF
ncbi:hypothetical protein BHE90_000419 [Fusarium euwallaceae]|uniref:PB1 domain-containing protein n=1 Tax=Fusarium euwallaceae TaxID=1147111 RepID=A0A430MAI6_9HYPO|nr:hypothetical protein BHE90_000419 [Fusarium euwallaceae]